MNDNHADLLYFYAHAMQLSTQLLDIDPGGTEELTGKRISGMVWTMERRRRSVEAIGREKEGSSPKDYCATGCDVLCCAVLCFSSLQRQKVRMPFCRPDGILQAEEDGLRGRGIGSALLHVAYGVEQSGIRCDRCSDMPLALRFSGFPLPAPVKNGCLRFG